MRIVPVTKEGRRSLFRIFAHEEGLNYPCAGYKAFFLHIDKSTKVMANLIKQGRYADEIMQMSKVTATRAGDASAGH